MSHFKERTEKNCLNCGTEVKGRFCHICGQENIEPRETVWGLITHFFHDITHFDGKFFTTGKLLITKPGYLSKEYILGRRARHLHPIRMYVFTSALFFILFFSFFYSVKDLGFYDTDAKERANRPNRSKKSTDALKPSVPVAKDTVQKDTSTGTYRFQPKVSDTSAAKPKPVERQELPDTPVKKKAVLPDSTAQKGGDEKSKETRDNFNLLLDVDEFKTVAEYDSAQQKLKPADRDGFFTRAIKHKEIEIDARVQKEGMTAVMRQWTDKFIHSFPQILFFSLPLVALILQLLYIRRRKQFYYVNHGIFLIHIYIYSFINLILFFCVDKFEDATGWGWLFWVKLVLVLHAFWYVYKAMRKFYGQGRFKTIVKFLLLNILTIFVISFLFMFFFLFSAWNL